MTDVYIEAGSKRVFASAVDWPGWSRSGKTEEAALEALAASAARYAVIAKQAGIPFNAKTAATFKLVERLPGTVSTDFGVPEAIRKGDHAPVTGKDAKRNADLLAAAWAVFDGAVARAPASLRKGPRGGGRDRDQIAEHVVGAEDMYARKIGLRIKDPQERRTAILDANRTGSAAIPEKGWPIRYAVRRIAWHVIDHAWEIEDRRNPD
ncbi:MAG: hypothetical protein ABI401_13115 [Candidatus Dormibacter sp.]